MPTFKRGCVVLILIGVSACGGSNPPPPLFAPGTGASTPSSVSVNCQTTTLTTVGQQTQCSAVAILANGTSQDQALASQWSSGSASVASVSATGLVTAVSNGFVTITSTFQGLQGARAVSVVTTTFTLTGTLTDGTSHGILPNITIQIVSGTNVGKSAVTDRSGNYAMSGLSAGTFMLSVSAISYQTTTQQVTLSANTRVDLVLQRVTLSSLTVSRDDSTLLYRFTTTQCTASAHYSDGGSAVPASGVTWQSSNTSAATVDSTGLVTTVAAGANTAFITAAFQGLSASFLLTLKGCGIIVPVCL
jgi:trimeric autotransporter adhesin